MLCKDVEDKIIDYIDGLLEKEDYLIVKNHIENCAGCKNNLEELTQAIDCIGEINKNINPPCNLMEIVRKNVEIKRKLTKKPRFKVGYIVLVSILSALLITGVFANESIKTYFEVWKDKGLEESQSIDQLILDGYGENLDLICEDKNIRVKIESVVADNINTVFLIEVEDLNGEKKYAPILGDKTTFANGNFNYYLPGKDVFKVDKARVQGSFLIHTPEKNKTRTVLAFNPVASEQEEIEIIINALEAISEKDTTLPHAIGGEYYYDKNFENIVEGFWSFNVPIKPSQSITFDINEEMDLDGHKITFNKLIVSPTMTTLTYKFNKRQNKEYIVDYLNNINIEADGKLYEMKSYGRSSSTANVFGPSEAMIPFDTMYFKIPKKIKIVVEGYSITVKDQHVLEIDVDKPFPQDFDYLGSKIRVTNAQGDENLIRVSMDNIGEKYFERLLFHTLINGKEYIETQYAVKPFLSDGSHSKQVSSYDILLNNTTNTFDDYPKNGYRVSGRTVNYLAYENDKKVVDELKLKDTLDDKIKSVIIKIEGYQENRNTTGSITLKLNKYIQ